MRASLRLPLASRWSSWRQGTFQLLGLPLFTTSLSSLFRIHHVSDCAYRWVESCGMPSSWPCLEDSSLRLFLSCVCILEAVGDNKRLAITSGVFVQRAGRTYSPSEATTFIHSLASSRNSRLPVLSQTSRMELPSVAVDVGSPPSWDRPVASPSVT